MPITLYKTVEAITESDLNECIRLKLTTFNCDPPEDFNVEQEDFFVDVINNYAKSFYVGQRLIIEISEFEEKK